MAHGTSRRDPAKESFWRQRVAAHADSGLSVRNFCRQHDLKEVAFYWWRRELKRRDAECGDVTATDQRAVSVNVGTTGHGGTRCVASGDVAAADTPVASDDAIATGDSVASGDVGRDEKSHSAFVPVHVTDDVADGDGGIIEIVLTDGRCVRVTGLVNRQMLADVLDVLTSASSVVLERRAC